MSHKHEDQSTARGRRLERELSRLAFENQLPRVPLRIAGVRVDLLSASAAFRTRVESYFRDFRGEGPAEGELRMEPLSDAEASLWDDPNPEFEIQNRQVVQRDFAARRLAPSPGAAMERAVAWAAPELDDAFHNLLRWFTPPLLLRNNAFLLHGAAVIRDGRGYVFFGHSEAGKSTSIALITQADSAALPLGDDGVIIQMKGDVPWVHAAPLGCGYSREAPPAASAPIAGLYALRQSDHDSLEPLAPATAAAALFASAMSVDFEESNEAKLELALRFASTQPGIQRLHFRKNPAFWSLILDKTARCAPKGATHVKS
ncbi:MAG: hypothetical protein NDJ90_08390 [Oligoflexia bacterium]|nr:hypothetical protein [Oligoflexia bacterium]